LNEVLIDKKFVILFLIAYCLPLYIMYLLLYTKLIFMPIVNDDHYLATCHIAATVSALFGAPYWGYIGDKLPFKTTLTIIIGIDFIAKIFGLFCQ
jgi:MFS-type transporter involved in bile tolerance (Atg22 family)